MKRTYTNQDGDRVNMDNLVHADGDRWVVAEWSERNGQWQSDNIREVPFEGYRLTFGKTLAQIVNKGIKSYASREAAVRAAVRHYELEVEVSEPMVGRSIRFTDAEWARVGELADAANLDVSSYVRAKLL
jgi:hypothetical protein